RHRRAGRYARTAWCPRPGCPEAPPAPPRSRADFHAASGGPRAIIPRAGELSTGGGHLLPVTSHVCRSHPSRRRHSMKVLTIGLVGLVSAGLGVGNAFAFSCPSLVKAANEAIARAEPMPRRATDEKQRPLTMGR